jgi:ribosomal 30S subunit maturation factor RimM
LVVRPAGSADAEILIPMVEGICRGVDVVGRTIEIEPVAGLLEVNEKAAAATAAGGTHRDR